MNRFAHRSFLSLMAPVLVAVIKSENIVVNNGETGGLWRTMETCPSGSKAYAFDAQNDFVGVLDKTALNTVRLYCNDPLDTNITSFLGENGLFGGRSACDADHFLTSFELLVSPNGNTSDNTAANNIRFMCNNGRILSQVGNNEGYWGSYSPSCEFGICGIQTRYNPNVALADNTAINDVRFQCCTA